MQFDMKYLGSVIFPKNFRNFPNCYRYGSQSTTLAVGDDPGFGCLQPTIRNKTACLKIGGQWLEPSPPFTRCRDSHTGCNLPFLTENMFTDITEECKSCSGFNTPIFQTIRVCYLTRLGLVVVNKQHEYRVFGRQLSQSNWIGSNPKWNLFTSGSQPWASYSSRMHWETRLDSNTTLRSRLRSLVSIRKLSPSWTRWYVTATKVEPSPTSATRGPPRLRLTSSSALIHSKSRLSRLI